MNAIVNKAVTKISDQLMFKQVLATALEKTINKVLSLNIHDNSALTDLSEQRLTMVISELAFPLTLSVYQQQILVTSTDDNCNESSINECIIKTSIGTLKELQQTQQLTELIKQDKLDIYGDIKIAQQFASLAQTLEIDWQSELAKHIGDFATYKLTCAGKTLAKKFSFLKKQVQADSSEYIVHEQKLVITKHQLNEFNQAVSQVSEQTDKLAQRLAAIKAASLKINQG